MCGIVGYVGVSGGIDTDQLIACRDTLSHRGRDDAGYWLSADGRVAFGHRRLAIVELTAAGAQLMAYNALGSDAALCAFGWLKRLKRAM
jgi:asparagine synthase (glutamine-hydrolysing)